MVYHKLSYPVTYSKLSKSGQIFPSLTSIYLPYPTSLACFMHIEVQHTGWSYLLDVPDLHHKHLTQSRQNRLRSPTLSIPSTLSPSILRQILLSLPINFSKDVMICFRFWAEAEADPILLITSEMFLMCSGLACFKVFPSAMPLRARMFEGLSMSKIRGILKGNCIIQNQLSIISIITLNRTQQISILMMRVLCVALLLISSWAINFSFHLPSQQTQCFYDYFYHQTKYRISAGPEFPISYAVEQVYLQKTGTQNEPRSLALYQHVKGNSDYHQTVQVNKYASQEGIHGVCIRSLSQQGSNFKIILESGIELMELESLPGANDTEILNSQLTLLQKEYQVILDSLTSIESSKSMTQQMVSLMSGRTILFGVMGLVVIVGINVIFYNLIKKSLKDKKRI